VAVAVAVALVCLIELFTVALASLVLSCSLPMCTKRLLCVGSQLPGWRAGLRLRVKCLPLAIERVLPFLSFRPQHPFLSLPFPIFDPKARKEVAAFTLCAQNRSFTLSPQKRSTAGPLFDSLTVRGTSGRLQGPSKALMHKELQPGARGKDQSSAASSQRQKATVNLSREQVYTRSVPACHLSRYRPTCEA
jgi:hypothetical protein